MNLKARASASYFIAIIDDLMCFDYVNLISHKSKALECFKICMNEVEN